MFEKPVIDVHGMTREQAIQTIRINLREFYDQGFNEVHIIHGHGQGILKAYVRALLKQLSYVKSMKKANNDGATIAIFS